MRRVERFTLLAHTGETDTWPLESWLLADGEISGTRLPGVEILEQFEIVAGYLPVTDYDCPFEETFHFIVLDHELRTVSQRSLGARAFHSCLTVASIYCKTCVGKTTGISWSSSRTVPSAGALLSANLPFPCCVRNATSPAYEQRMNPWSNRSALSFLQPRASRDTVAM
jgi:hypothetical protein